MSWCLRGNFRLVETVTQLTNQLVASYAKAGGINHLDGKNLPSKRVVTVITQDLLRLLFPGFFDEKLIHSSEVKVETAALLDSVLGKLEDEIRKASNTIRPPASPKKDITQSGAQADGGISRQPAAHPRSFADGRGGGVRRRPGGGEQRGNYCLVSVHRGHFRAAAGA